jgi:lysozyme
MAKRRKKVKLKTTLIKALLFLLLIGAGGYYFYSKFLRPPVHQNYGVRIPEGFNSFGIDVSHHQGKIDWDKLLAVTQINNQQPAFVYLKATEGTNHTDTQWKKNRDECLRLSIKHGAYHFFQPKKLPLPQAEHFLNHYQPITGDLPPVLDVEIDGFSDEDLIHKMERWLEYVEEKTGMRPVIYTSYHFYSSKLKSAFPHHKFWIAAYSRKPRGLDNNKQIIHWQFTEKAQLPGHYVLVDMNVSKVSF